MKQRRAARHVRTRIPEITYTAFVAVVLLTLLSDAGARRAPMETQALTGEAVTWRPGRSDAAAQGPAADGAAPLRAPTGAWDDGAASPMSPGPSRPMPACRDDPGSHRRSGP